VRHSGSGSGLPLTLAAASARALMIAPQRVYPERKGKCCLRRDLADPGAIFLLT